MDKLTERQVIGTFYKTLEQDTGIGWVNLLANYFPSDMASEVYAWLGQVAGLREWIGGRNAKGLPESNMTIINKHYEDTLEILVRDLRRDKSGQALIRIAEMAERSNAHWASLLSTLILNAEATACYDGQYFFDTDHSEGDSGTQDNDINVDLSGLPITKTGSTTQPSVADMQFAIMKGIEAIVGFKDNQGEPMNETATAFLAMVPPTFLHVGLQAVATPRQVNADQSALPEIQKEFTIKVVPNVRLSSWTTKFAVFRTDSRLKSFIMQEETGVQMKAKGYGSEYEFDNDAHQYGIDTWRNVGYGMWQHSCLITLT